MASERNAAVENESTVQETTDNDTQSVTFEFQTLLEEYRTTTAHTMRWLNETKKVLRF
jgi:hypothetical protein